MKPPEPEREVLLLCAAQRLPADGAGRLAALCARPGFDWGGLFQATTAHQIAPLVLAHLERAGAVGAMPPAVAGRWKLLRTRNILAKKNHARVIRQLAGFLAGRSVRVMLLKGAALDAVLYQEPWYTQSADADLMADRHYGDLAEADRAAADAILKGARVELDWARHHDLDMNRVLDIDYGRFWAGARPVPLGDTQGYVLSPEDMLLTGCINLCRKRYRLLKWMVGIRELIAAYHDVSWEKLGRNAAACGASGIVYAALTVTTVVLGFELPCQATDALRVGFARRRAIDWLCRLLGRCLFRAPTGTRESVASLVTSYLLRLTSYRVPQFWREVRGLIRLRRVRAIYRKARAARQGAGTALAQPAAKLVRDSRPPHPAPPMGQAIPQ